MDAARAKRFSGEGCNHHVIDIRTTWMIYNDNRRGGQDNLAEFRRLNFITKWPSYDLASIKVKILSRQSDRIGKYRVSP